MMRNGPRSIDDVLTAARARLRRLDPWATVAALAAGALLVDIRPVEVRRRDGEVSGALIVDRNVLEWRLDPSSPDRLATVRGHDQTIILFCTEGYASSLAAAALQDLGLVNATDLEGGFVAWAAAGLPVHHARDARPSLLELITETTARPDAETAAL
jgi:rhodanese-related sulfurtransferase